MPVGGEEVDGQEAGDAAEEGDHTLARVVSAVAPGAQPGLLGGEVVLGAVASPDAMEQAAAEQFFEPESLRRRIGGKSFGSADLQEDPVPRVGVRAAGVGADLVDGARLVVIGMRQDPAAAVPEAAVQAFLRRDAAHRIGAFVVGHGER